MRGINRNSVKFNNNSQITPLRGRTCSCKPSFLFPPRGQSAAESLLAGLSRSTTESSIPAPLNISCLSRMVVLLFIILKTPSLSG